MQSTKTSFKDRMIPWYFVIFFVFLAIINVIFVMIARTTHTEVVQDNAYETGLHYNDIIKQYNDQSALGWEVSFDFDSQNNMIVLSAIDANNQHITNATVKGIAISVLNKKQEISFELKDNHNKNYVTNLDLPHKGQWDIYVIIAKDNKSMQIKKRVMKIK